MTGGRKLTVQRTRTKERAKKNAALNATNPLLTELSGELRNRIWALVVGEGEHHTIAEGVEGGWDVKSERYQGTRFPSPPLLHVCKQIREEAAHVLYAYNKFTIHLVEATNYAKRNSAPGLKDNAGKEPFHVRDPLRGFPCTILQQLRHANITSSLYSIGYKSRMDPGDYHPGFAEVVIRHDDVSFFGGDWPSGNSAHPNTTTMIDDGRINNYYTNRRYLDPPVVHNPDIKDRTSWYLEALRWGIVKKMAKRDIDWSDGRQQRPVAAEERAYPFEVEWELA